MRVIIARDGEQMSKRAADIVAGGIRRKPHFVLGLDVSDALLGTYGELARLHREEELDLSRVVTFNLDEYLGLAPDHPQSCRFFMESHLFKHVNIDERNICFLNGLTREPEMQFKQYEQALKEVAGVDLQILGIGRDGHIGFNEPGSSLGSRMRIKTLMEDVIQDRITKFEDPGDVPRFALTMGVGNIMEARMVLVVASGKRKADVLVRAIEGPLTASVPASVLQLHRSVIVVADEEAAAGLSRLDYYRLVDKASGEFESDEV